MTTTSKQKLLRLFFIAFWMDAKVRFFVLGESSWKKVLMRIASQLKLIYFSLLIAVIWGSSYIPGISKQGNTQKTVAKLLALVVVFFTIYQLYKTVVEFLRKKNQEIGTILDRIVQSYIKKTANEITLKSFVDRALVIAKCVRISTIVNVPGLKLKQRELTNINNELSSNLIKLWDPKNNQILVGTPEESELRINRFRLIANYRRINRIPEDRIFNTIEMVVSPWGKLSFPKEFNKLISSPLFVKLEGTSQLSFCNHKYVSATQTRLAHVLGVYYLATIAWQAVQENSKNELDYIVQEMIRYYKRGGLDLTNSKLLIVIRNTFYIAALIHDLFHGPFGHSLEFLARHAVKYSPPELNKSRAKYDKQLLCEFLETTDEDFLDQYCIDIDHLPSLEKNNLDGSGSESKLPYSRELLRFILGYGITVNPQEKEEANPEFTMIEKNCLWMKTLLDNPIVDIDRIAYLVQDNLASGWDADGIVYYSNQAIRLLSSLKLIYHIPPDEISPNKTLVCYKENLKISDLVDSLDMSMGPTYSGFLPCFLFSQDKIVTEFVELRKQMYAWVYNEINKRPVDAILNLICLWIFDRYQKDVKLHVQGKALIKKRRDFFENTSKTALFLTEFEFRDYLETMLAAVERLNPVPLVPSTAPEGETPHLRETPDNNDYEISVPSIRSLLNSIYDSQFDLIPYCVWKEFDYAEDYEKLLLKELHNSLFFEKINEKIAIFNKKYEAITEKKFEADGYETYTSTLKELEKILERLNFRAKRNSDEPLGFFEYLILPYSYERIGKHKKENDTSFHGIRLYSDQSQGISSISYALYHTLREVKGTVPPKNYGNSFIIVHEGLLDLIEKKEDIADTIAEEIEKIVGIDRKLLNALVLKQIIDRKRTEKLETNLHIIDEEMTQRCRRLVIWKKTDAINFCRDKQIPGGTLGKNMYLETEKKTFAKRYLGNMVFEKGTIVDTHLGLLSNISEVLSVLEYVMFNIEKILQRSFIE